MGICPISISSTQRILISSIGQLINELPTLDLPNAAIVTTIGDFEQYDTTRGAKGTVFTNNDSLSFQNEGT
ncbi:MAG: hypothetical protein CM1200mP24_05440 [Gammaproteobacteria bacterium]|nr:MAG: hypothetical protein CM1200mP24_05440 [Gammaproteobacteria bacterium]